MLSLKTKPRGKVQTRSDPETIMLGRIGRRLETLLKQSADAEADVTEAELILSQNGLWQGTLPSLKPADVAATLIVENDLVREAIDRRSMNPQSAESVPELVRMVLIPDEHLT